ncbi:MAG: restriction system protein [Rhodospirillaceae bacterium]|nr:MAG: restriction system protein [Rhodospirillaceae bacterium]
MAIPDYQSLMLPVLEIACTGESSVPETEAAITTRFGLTPEESEQRLPSGKQRVLPNRIHWAKFYLTKAGFLETPRRGRFAITDSGRHLLAHPPETFLV